jgi:hypothetical protein
MVTAALQKSLMHGLVHGRSRFNCYAALHQTKLKGFISSILTILAAFQLYTATATLGSTCYINLQDDNGNTRVSISWSSDITGTGVSAPYSDWVGVGGLFLNSMGGSGGTLNYIYGLGGFTGYVETLPLFGTLEDLTTGGSATINSFVAIPNYGGDESVIDIRFDTDLPNSASDLIRYVPNVDSATIPVPFSSFNPGTYQVSPQQPIGMVLTVESIPEPSTLYMSALGALGILLIRRRSHAA